MSAIDLSTFNDGIIGPREKQALLNEIEMLTHTRELSLRREATLEGQVEVYSKVLAVLTDLHGEARDAATILTIDGERFREVSEKVASFELVPNGDSLDLAVTYAYAGTWEVTSREPSDEELEALRWFEELPAKMSEPGPMLAVTPTKKGLRIAEWTPSG